jgi:hypothetical protein
MQKEGRISKYRVGLLKTKERADSSESGRFWPALQGSYVGVLSSSDSLTLDQFT